MNGLVLHNSNLEICGFWQKPCRYTVFWKKIHLVHRYKPHEVRFWAARFFSGTKIRVSRGLAVFPLCCKSDSLANHNTVQCVDQLDYHAVLWFKFQDSVFCLNLLIYFSGFFHDECWKQKKKKKLLVRHFGLIQYLPTKGQLILKANFKNFIWTKKPKRLIQCYLSYIYLIFSWFDHF